MIRSVFILIASSSTDSVRSFVMSMVETVCGADGSTSSPTLSHLAASVVLANVSSFLTTLLSSILLVARGWSGAI